MAEALAGLQLLVKAPSKSAVNSIFVLMFEKRAEGLSDTEEQQIASALSLSPEELQHLLAGIRLLLRVALKKNVSAEELVAALPDSVDKRLGSLIGKIVGAHIDEWRETLVRDRAAGAPTSPEPAKRKQHAARDEQQQQQQEVPPAPAAAPEPQQEQSPKKKEVKEREEAPEEQQQQEPKPQAEKPKKQKPAPAPEPSSAPEPEPLPVPAPAPEPKQQQQQPKRKQEAQQKQPQPQAQAGPSLLQPSLPRLEGFDWRVDIRSASDAVARMAAPTVIVQMRVQPERLVTFELSKESLTTMLDGLKFVRDQLAGISAK